MADDQRIADIMDKVFNSITLLNVQTESLSKKVTKPIPTLRHQVARLSSQQDLPTLNKNDEFRAALLSSQQLDEDRSLCKTRLLSTATTDLSEIHKASSLDLKSGQLKNRSDLSVSSEPFCDSLYPEVESNGSVDKLIQLQRTKSQSIENDRTGESPKNSSSKDQLAAAELHSYQLSNYENDTLSTSRASEIANEFELLSTPVPPTSDDTEVNELTDDSEIETKEILSMSQTRCRTDSKKLCRLEKQEKKKTKSQRAHATKPLKSSTLEKSSPFEFIDSFDMNNTQNRVRAEIGLKIKLSDLKQALKSSSLNNDNKTAHRHPCQQNSHRSSYKHFLGQKSSEPRILRSNSVSNENFCSADFATNNKLKLLILDKKSKDFGQSQQYFHNRHASTGQKPISFPTQNSVKKLPLIQTKNNHHQHQHEKAKSSEFQRPTFTNGNSVAQHYTYQVKHNVNLKSPPSWRQSTTIEKRFLVEPNGYQSRKYLRYCRNSLQEHRHSMTGHEESPVQHYQAKKRLSEQHNGHEQSRFCCRQHGNSPQGSFYSSAVKSINAPVVYQHHHDSNNNFEMSNSTAVSKLCIVFEGHKMALNRFNSASTSPLNSCQAKSSAEMGKYYAAMPRMIISDDTAQGKGSCSPGSISALHRSILTANPIIRQTAFSESVEESNTTRKKQSSIVENKKQRKPKTLAAFYDRWGRLPTQFPVKSSQQNLW